MIARLQAWGTAVVAAAIAVLAALGWGRLKGARVARELARARVAASEHQTAVIERVVDQAKTRTEVDTDVLQLPTGALEPISSAVPDSAADRLYDDWSRDDHNVGLRVDAADSGVAPGSTDRPDGPANSDP